MRARDAPARGRVAMFIQVETVRDEAGVETPIRLDFDGRSVAVVETMDRWPGPDYCYFKARGGDGALYILRRDQVRDLWELTMFERSPESLPR